MKRALIDLSSVVWTGLLSGKDSEFGIKVMHNDKEVLVNSAAYGYDNCMEFMVRVLEDLDIPPRQVILVMEGKNSKQNRQTLHPGYKAGRDKVSEQYEQFNLCKEMVIKALLDVGAQEVHQDGGVEADDVLAYLARNLEGERWIVSGDKDLAAAVDIPAGIHHYRAGVRDANPFGDFPHKWITTYIALVGDASDKISGAKGFGDTKFQLLLERFGDDGLEMMQGLIQRKELLRLDEDIPACMSAGPKGQPMHNDLSRGLQKIIDDQEGVYISYELARLQVEKVNTLRRPLVWRAGMVKPRASCEDARLRKWAGVNRIVSAENYEDAVKFARGQIARSPYVALDIETSTPQASDDWLESRDKSDRVDVFGSELTSLQITFGPNMQYTMYLPYDNVEEPGCANLSMKQVADFVDLVPRELVMLIQNVSFELPICYMSWGEMWKDDPLYHGFLRNARDTKIMSSYVNENRSSGLKQNSKLLLDYDQVSYDQVTTRDELRSAWDGVGKVVQTYMEPILEDTGETETVGEGNVIPKLKHVGDVEHVMVQRKMNQLAAREVLAYGCDDTICTAAVANHFMAVMEIEKSWHVFEDVETFPAYLTALAYVQGTGFRLESMAAQEKEDDAAFNAAEPVLMDYLMKIGFEGTRFVPLTALEPADIKRACFEMTGQELKTMVRTPSKLARLITEQDPESILPALINEGKLDLINQILESKFTGKPSLDLASSKEMRELLYGSMKLPVRLINDITPIEKAKLPALDLAVRNFKALRAGKSSTPLSPAEMLLMRKKAKTDDDAIKFALAFDADVIDDDARAALKAIGVMKRVMTMRSLYYANYWKGLHWKDGLLHCSTNQCAAVSRRYSMSDQNLQQLPKHGTGVRFRGHFVPHKRNAVVASIDFVGQELRLAADTSQDRNLLACYVGDDLKDPHSLTAGGALKQAWGSAYVAGLFETYAAELTRDDDGIYALFLRMLQLPKDNPLRKKAEDHRKGAKNTNFAAQNGARAVKISEMETMLLVDAQRFLDGREAMFPGVTQAAEKCGDSAKKLGYATTYMGVRRHLQEAMLSDERGAADRAARQAWSTRIQGSAGEMIKLAMGRLWVSGVYFRYDARFIAPIHDELVSSVVKEHAVDFLREKNAAMTHPYSTMKVPILGSISLGKNFAEQIECGNWFIQERIEGALNDIFAMKEAA